MFSGLISPQNSRLLILKGLLKSKGPSSEIASKLTQGCCPFLMGGIIVSNYLAWVRTGLDHITGHLKSAGSFSTDQPMIATFAICLPTPKKKDDYESHYGQDDKLQSQWHGLLGGKYATKPPKYPLQTLSYSLIKQILCFPPWSTVSSTLWYFGTDVFSTCSVSWSNNFNCSSDHWASIRLISKCGD